ncbi:protein ABHD11 isoform X1 [Hemiscyllium ocellatum]|uniref:protein ABHD11 isoform X1 n=1 Tax=Hemiscyllium ocellatum TaxID=170820 RepID=UPI0029676633|nr:protein ABHD11 isoform X1 [Hemiscyllium ocellatum]
MRVLLLGHGRWAGLLRRCLPAWVPALPVAYSRLAQDTALRPVDLAYDVLDGRNTETPLVFLHGLFGSKSNFNSIAKALSQRTGRMVVTVDNRNHGDSEHNPVMTYEAMSIDCQNLLNSLQLPKCIMIGHSMGGKIAMTIALQKPELIEKLVVVDVTPSQTTLHTSFPKYIVGMRKITVDGDLPRSTARKQAEQQLQPYIKEGNIRQFLLTNLVKHDGQYIWRVNLEAVANQMDCLLNFPKFDSPYTAPTLFLGGGNSPYISDKEYPEIKRLFPNSVIDHVPGAGHWIHAEKPHDFINAICAFLGTS